MTLNKPPLGSRARQIAGDVLSQQRPSTKGTTAIFDTTRLPNNNNNILLLSQYSTNNSLHEFPK